MKKENESFVKIDEVLRRWEEGSLSPKQAVEDFVYYSIRYAMKLNKPASFGTTYIFKQLGGKINIHTLRTIIKRSELLLRGQGNVHGKWHSVWSIKGVYEWDDTTSKYVDKVSSKWTNLQESNLVQSELTSHINLVHNELTLPPNLVQSELSTIEEKNKEENPYKEEKRENTSAQTQTQTQTSKQKTLSQEIQSRQNQKQEETEPMQTMTDDNQIETDDSDMTMWIIKEQRKLCKKTYGKVRLYDLKPDWDLPLATKIIDHNPYWSKADWTSNISTWLMTIPQIEATARSLKLSNYLDYLKKSVKQGKQGKQSQPVVTQSISVIQDELFAKDVKDLSCDWIANSPIPSNPNSQKSEIKIILENLGLDLGYKFLGKYRQGYSTDMIIKTISDRLDIKLWNDVDFAKKVMTRTIDFNQQGLKSPRNDLFVSIWQLIQTSALKSHLCLTDRFHGQRGRDISGKIIELLHLQG